MSDVMQVLMDYTCNFRLPRYLDQSACEESERLEKKLLAALKEELSGGQLATLERYQDACREQHVLRQEALFFAAFSVARELL